MRTCSSRRSATGEQGRPKEVPVREGEILLLPGHVRHSPQRPDAGLELAARGKGRLKTLCHLDRFCVDSAVFDPRALRLLVDVMGEDHVMLGSDYPFPLGELRVGKLLRDMQGLSEKARGKLLAGNARRFLGLA